LLARSPRAELRNKYIGIRPALGNHDAASSTDSDHYYRQVMSTEVTIRNNRLQATL